jgi:hypothetical protein
MNGHELTQQAEATDAVMLDAIGRLTNKSEAVQDAASAALEAAALSAHRRRFVVKGAERDLDAEVSTEKHDVFAAATANMGRVEDALDRALEVLDEWT